MAPMPFFRKKRPQGDEVTHGSDSRVGRHESTPEARRTRAHPTPVGAFGHAARSLVDPERRSSGSHEVSTAQSASPLRASVLSDLDPAPRPDVEPLGRDRDDVVPADAGHPADHGVAPDLHDDAPVHDDAPLHDDADPHTTTHVPPARLLARVVAEPAVPPEETQYARLLAPGLLEVLALDDPDTWLSDDALAEYGDLTELWVEGRALLRDVVADHHETVEDDAGRALVLRSHSPHLASTILVLPDVVAHHTGVAPDPETGVFVAIPHRRAVVVHVLRDASAAASLQTLFRLATTEFAAAEPEDAISPDVHWWHEGRFETVLQQVGGLGDPAVTEVGPELGEILHRLCRP